ncbi:Multimodular transpeptidase-transglycosylase [hydrothermal vent metagenome]|uniref:Penicillin-binding protein 1A n=1 Tax=hydrothermal vent metagenome TaxID=652676 RepID=A0A3B0W9W6_9ZZZZ
MRFLNVFKLLIVVTLVMTSLAGVVAAGGYFYLNPKLPSIEGLSDVQLQVPLRIYSSDGALMGEFGEKRRTPKKLDEIPALMKQAFLSAEDDRFFEHPGVDYQGILRAVVNLIMTGKRGQGGSTITMQLARNFYLTSEKTYLRKLNEILLALKIERELNKEKILELYLNKIYLGNRSYGVAAAAQTYYGVTLDELTLPQIAMIAGLPKAPSTYNPIVNPERALIRRDYVLSRMRYLEFISAAQFEESKSTAVTATRHRSNIGVYAPYVNEMARAEIVKQFGDEAYARGLKVYTTINKRLQQAANDSIWNGLVAYDKRHGYRGVVRHVELNPENKTTAVDDSANGELFVEENIESKDQPDLVEVLKEDENYGHFMPALILSVNDDISANAAAANKATTSNGTASVAASIEQRSATALLKDGNQVRIPWSGIKWAREYVSVNRIGAELQSVSEVIKPGDVVWLAKHPVTGWSLAQIPEAQGALVSLQPNTGAIQALIGGFDFEHSKFNRVVQAKRQAGSGFKPIIYAAALDKMYTPASLINDAPVVFEDSALEGEWRPENYSGKTFGPTRLRMALYKSRNLVSIRILRAIGLRHATQYAENFGLNSKELRHDLSLALGSTELSPLQMARIFSVFANGGYLTKPYLIQRIEDADGSPLYEADPAIACVSCVIREQKWSAKVAEDDSLAKLPKQAERTLEPRLAFQMNSILQDVVLRGTGRRAMAMGRKDLAGKTGTTNDQRDAWFNGYNPSLVTTVWTGFDQLKPLGSRETGSSAALPIWMDFMKVALAGKPEKQLHRPDGLVTMKINAETGRAATDGDTNTVFEIFRKEKVPVTGTVLPAESAANGNGAAAIPEQLF